MQEFSIPICSLNTTCEALRIEVRDFLERELSGVSAELRAENWSGFDTDFSRRLGARGWIGMTWPSHYGGHERSALERYVVLEELLAAGAPVAAHWVADRQSGPLLLKYGNEELKQALLPRMALGEVVFCIGMSEPDSGSDLASIRSRGDRTATGWLLNGTKLWTSHATHADYMIALVRTTPSEGAKQAGLSQFLIDMRTPGIEVNPVKNLLGQAHFNEVVLTNVEVPDRCLIGLEGEGWSQVTAELALERSGPERYLSSVQLLIEMIDAGHADNERHSITIGKLVAEIATLRQMSLGIAGMLSRGESASLLAPVVKDQGALFEQRMPEVAHDLFGVQAGRSSSSLEKVMAYTAQAAPSFSLRGGAREILRGIISKGLGLK